MKIETGKRITDRISESKCGKYYISSDLDANTHWDWIGLPLMDSRKAYTTNNGVEIYEEIREKNLATEHALTSYMRQLNDVAKALHIRKTKK